MGPSVDEALLWLGWPHAEDSSSACSASAGGTRGLALSVVAKLKAGRPLSMFRPRDLKRDEQRAGVPRGWPRGVTRIALRSRLAARLCGDGPQSAVRRVVAPRVLHTTGHVLGGATLFFVYDLAARCAGEDAGAAAPGAVAGAAHAVATSPFVIFQRTGKIDLLAGARSPQIVCRDAASFAAFFAVHGRLAPPRHHAARARAPDDPGAFRGLDWHAIAAGAAAGVAAGLACHTVRFPLQTVYKRGRGWIDGADLRPRALAARFAATSVRAALSAGVAFGALEVLISAFDVYYLESYV